MSSKKVIIAGAGTGKTSHLVEKALEIKEENVLITTYTVENKEEIEEKIIEKNGYIPNNIHVVAWLSFLIKNFIKPYKSAFEIKDKINGTFQVNGKSGVKFTKAGKTFYYKSVEKGFYLNKQNKIYTDKVSNLSVKINELSDNKSINRLEKIYSYIFIDEMQDFVGYDLEIIKLILNTNINVILVGDPRQNVYDTHYTNKYKKYNDGSIKNFIINECKKSKVEIDETTLNICHRCDEQIVDFANEFYDEYKPLESSEKDVVKHTGVFYITTEDVNKYLEKCTPVQLINDKKTKCNNNYKSVNYRKSKGKSYDHVLVYPTSDFKKYLESGLKPLKRITKNKFYVVMTRARYSLAFVIDTKKDLKIKKWEE